VCPRGPVRSMMRTSPNPKFARKLRCRDNGCMTGRCAKSSRRHTVHSRKPLDLLCFRCGRAPSTLLGRRRCIPQLCGHWPQRRPRCPHLIGLAQQRYRRRRCTS
jgi:hypothetical protein